MIVVATGGPSPGVTSIRYVPTDLREREGVVARREAVRVSGEAEGAVEVVLKACYTRVRRGNYL